MLFLNKHILNNNYSRSVSHHNNITVISSHNYYELIPKVEKMYENYSQDVTFHLREVSG